MPLQHPSNSIHSYLMRPWQMTWFIYSFDSWAIFSHLFIARLKIFANACAMCRCVSECANKSVEFIQHLHNLIFQIYYCRFFFECVDKMKFQCYRPICNVLCAEIIDKLCAHRRQEESVNSFNFVSRVELKWDGLQEV